MYVKCNIIHKKIFQSGRVYYIESLQSTPTGQLLICVLTYFWILELSVSQLSTRLNDALIPSSIIWYSHLSPQLHSIWLPDRSMITWSRRWCLNIASIAHGTFLRRTFLISCLRSFIWLAKASSEIYIVHTKCDIYIFIDNHKLN